MDESPDTAPDIDALVEQLRERVRARKESGQLPADVEASLAAQFERIVAHRPGPFDYEGLRHKLHSLDELVGFTPSRIRYESGVPGGENLHRLIAKVVARQTNGILEQVQTFAAAVRELLFEMAAVLENPDAHTHAELLGQVDAILDRLAAYERLPANGSIAVGNLDARLARLEAIEDQRQFRPWFASDRFEEEFRGSPSELRSRYADLAGVFDGCGPVVDLGCGRGEFLSLLKDRGIDAIGVELDEQLVQAGVSADLDVRHGDAVDWLTRLPNESLGGMSLIQVVEHLTPQEVVEVVALAHSKVRAGGRVLVETVNPQSLYVYARAFYADPTHDHPVHPAYLSFLFNEAGFSDVAIQWRSPPPEAETLERIDSEDEIAKATNANTDRLNQLIFGPQDYALIATR